MKKRYSGGFAIVIFALGFMMSQFWNFGGFGTSEGEQENNQGASAEEGNDSVFSEAAGEVLELDNTTAGGEMNASLTSASRGQEKTVTIVIHADRYRMTTEDDPAIGADVSLNEVVRQVKKATGGDQGVKLRILFQKNAQEGALADLHTALAEADVKREEIQEISDYID